MEFYQCQASPDHRKLTNAFVTAGRLGESQSGGRHLSSRTLTEKVSQFLRPSGLDWQGKLTVGTISTAVSVSHDDIHRIVFLKVML